MIKYTFNKKFYFRPEFGYFSFIDTKLIADDYNYKYISPSLRLIAMKPEYLVKFYPDFFFIAFPDVVYWTLEAGILKVNELLGSYKRPYLFMNGVLSKDIIKKIIDLYIKTTNQKLECGIIDQSNFL